MNIKFDISFEKFNLEEPVKNIGDPEEEYGLINLNREVVRENPFLLEEIFYILSQTSSAYSKFFFLRC